MISIQELKARSNALLDEKYRLEGRIAEINYLIEWMQSPDAVEQEANKPVEVESQTPVEAKE